MAELRFSVSALSMEGEVMTSSQGMEKPGLGFPFQPCSEQGGLLFLESFHLRGKSGFRNVFQWQIPEKTKTLNLGNELSKPTG